MDIGSDDSKEAVPNRRSGIVIGLLGTLSIVAHGVPFFQVQEPTASVLTVVLPSLLGVVLVAVGYWTARVELVEPEEAWRLAAWVLAGMAVFLLVGVWIVVLDVLLGQPVPFGFLLTVNAVTLGGVVGAVIGLYDAQGREYTRKLERREQNLREQNERLDDFVSIVSHDLRNPLNVATGRLDLARAEYTSEHLEYVAQALERMEVLIEDLLELARQNQSTADIETITLADVVESCWRNVDTADAELDAETTVAIRADRSRLQQLLENLFRNAVEHGNENATITVDETTDGTGFYVEDDGPGIPEDEREEVFEPAYSTRTDGTGFGLAIVKAVVDAHDWEIRVTNGQHGGARFEITGVETER
ncbi:MAG: sensor histidine kinase [Halolamina sp.]